MKEERTIKYLTWKERNTFLPELIKYGRVIILGRNPPIDEEDFLVYVTINEVSAFVEKEQGCRVEVDNIAGLNVNYWNWQTLSYLKHWIAKVLDDSSIYNADQYIIEAIGNWRFKLENRKQD